MRILVISALYPPYHLGGYELRCKNIMDALADRGHVVLALTSQGGVVSRTQFPDTAYPVHRRLRFNTGGGIISRMMESRRSHALGMLLVFARELWFDWRDTAFVDGQIRQFRPDVIYLAHVTNLTKVLVPYLADMPIVYDEGGSGLIHLCTERGIWYKFADEYVSRHGVLNALKSLVVKAVCSISANRMKPRWTWPTGMGIVFNGELNYNNARAAGVPIAGARIIHSGIDTGRFVFRPRNRIGASPLIIVPGGFEPKKGQLDAVRLAARLVEKGVDVRMILVGARRSAQYFTEVKKEIGERNLTDRIDILPMVSQEKLVEYYHKADICFFPSHHRTGFSRVPLEAMASGCILISYGNEGSGEVVRDKYNGFLVRAGDLNGIAGVVRELMSNPREVSDIATNARSEVEREFSLGKYVDRIEQLIGGAVKPDRKICSEPSRREVMVWPSTRVDHESAANRGRPICRVDRRSVSGMRVLAISAHYPPYHLGGYELRCKSIMDALADRGHAILALTSQEGAVMRMPFPDVAYPVCRRLRFNTGGGIIDRMMERRRSHAFGMLLVLVRELWFDWRDTAFVDAQIRRFRPDVIYLGHVTNLTKALVPYLADMPIVYDEGGSGLIHLWTERGIWYKFTDEYFSRHAALNALKSFIVRAVCSMGANRMKPQWAWPGRMRVFFNGELGLRNATARGVPVSGAKVIHSGVDTRRFNLASRGSFGSPLQFLLPGGIVPRKGQIDGIRLLAKLREYGIDGNLIIVGKIWSDSYHRELTDEIKRLRLEKSVQLVTMITQDELASLYHKADICFFPSYQTAGFSRVPLEAMASGCIVISYGNEGSDEIIRDRHNGFLVPRADYESIVAVIKELTSRPDSVRAIAAAARSEVESRFSMQSYVDQVEEFLMSAADAGRRRSCPPGPTT